jgi:16S rRNA (uracil1498-N3)-methyltransferase
VGEFLPNHLIKNLFTGPTLWFKHQIMQKFIIKEIHSIPSTLQIEGQDARHISKVLRLNTKDHIKVTDGNGNDFLAEIQSLTHNLVTIEILEQIKSKTESEIRITLCTGMLKDKKMDMIIKHVTQLGITKWIPFFCKRSIPTPDVKRIEKRHTRWQTISRESLKQCQRSYLPQIMLPISFETLIEKSDSYDLKIAFWEKASRPLEKIEISKPVKKIMILIGPEGGFSQNEIKQAKEKEFLSYSLGPRILRAETASISACTLIQHLYGDI